MGIYYTKIKKKLDISTFNTSDTLFLQEKEKKKLTWNNDFTASFVLQFDDFSTQAKIHGAHYDYGGDPNSKINRMFEQLLKDFPFLKVTLFTVANPKFKRNGKTLKVWPENKFVITNPKFKEWISWIKEYEDQIEIANHGLYHWQDDIKFFLQNREFEFKNEKNCVSTILKAQNLFKKAGFDPKGFKPAGWGVGHNTNFALIKALKKIGLFEYVCLSSPRRGLNWKEKKVSNLFPSYYEGLLNIPQNLGILESNIYKKVDKIVKYHGVVSLQLHFNEQGNWMNDGIGSRTFKVLYKLFNHLKTKHKKEIWFAKMIDIAKWWKESQHFPSP